MKERDAKRSPPSAGPETQAEQERKTLARASFGAEGDEDEPALEPGVLIGGGRYRISSLLGEGGMGVVYRAEQVNLGREVAIKLLLRGAAARPDARRRFEREAKVASALRHPNAVEIYDVGEDEGRVYIAMQLLQGQTLWDAIGAEGATLPMSVALGIAAQLADVLVAAHDIGLVHRDLKPENVFLEDADEGWRVVVVDFGLAFITGQGGELGRMTREGLVVGTPPYLSPEQAGGLEVGTASDIYAFGCVLFELLTGYPPFQGSELHVLTQHLYVAPTAPSERSLNRKIPRELDELVLAMLRKRAEERPDAREVRAQLELVEGTLAGRRNRGRDASYLKTRQARMVSVPPEASKEVNIVFDSEGLGEPEAFRVGVHGDLDPAAWIALRTNGIVPIAWASGEPTGELEVLFTNARDAEGIAAATASGLPVVALGDARDMKGIAALLRSGVSEVVADPPSIDNLVRKLRRARQRRQRNESA